MLVYRSDWRQEINNEEEDIMRVTTTGKNYSSPGNIDGNVDVTSARYSPAFAPGQPRRHDSRNDAVTNSVDVVDEVVRRDYHVKQRSSPPPRQYDGPTWPYQNGFGGGYHDSVREDRDVRWRSYGITLPQRPAVGGQRASTERELRYRSPSAYDERVDTPQSGRLSQAAMMVRETFEDGEFDQEVAVTRGSNVTDLHRKL